MVNLAMFRQITSELAERSNTKGGILLRYVPRIPLYLKVASNYHNIEEILSTELLRAASLIKTISRQGIILGSFTCNGHRIQLGRIFYV